MRAQVRKAWESRSPRERAIIAALAVLLGVALYVWLVHSAVQARAQLRASVTTLRAQAASLDQQAFEYVRLRAAPAATASPTDLRALVRIDAPDANQVKVDFGALPFADWLAWVASLQAQQVRLDTCRIEALSTPGLVSVTATLVRAKPQ